MRKSPNLTRQLVYQAEGSAVHQRYIVVEALLAKLGLIRDDLLARKWPRGSPQHWLKRAAAINGVPKHSG